MTYGRLLDSLKTALRTQPHSYVLRFVEMDGLIHLLDALSAMDYDTSQSSVHTSLIGCVKALMNNSVGICNDQAPFFVVTLQNFRIFCYEMISMKKCCILRIKLRIESSFSDIIVKLLKKIFNF